MRKHAVNTALLAVAMMLAPAAARALIKYFASPDAARLMRANGLEPAG